MLKNTNQTYGSMARAIHWIMAVAIIGMLCVGLWMVGLPNGDTKWLVYGLHKATGFTLFMLLLFRIYWRLTNPVPKLPPHLPNFIEWLSKQNLRFLYLLMFLMPATGLLMSLLGGHEVSVYGLFTIPAFAEKLPDLAKIFWFGHTYVAYVLIATLVLHLSAALVHHFYFRDNILRRMLIGR